MANRLGYLLLGSVILIAQVSAYISSSYRGFLFTTPDNTDANRGTQHDAAIWCKNNGTRLLEIANGDVQTIVTEYIGNVFNKGLNGWTTVVNSRKYGQSWNWVNGEGINNLVVEQQGSDLTRSFGFLQSAGARIFVAAAAPTDRRAFICEGSSYCAAGVTFQHRCYRSYSDALSWFDARNRCLDGGGDLASFGFINDSPGLSVLNGTWLNSASSHWIGIRRLYWKWEDSNTEVKYTNWYDGHPELNYDCICLYHVGWKWITCDCGNRYQFICLTAISSFTSSTTTKAATPATSTKATSTTTTVANMLTRPTSSAARSSVTVNNLLSTSLSSSSLPVDPGIVHIGIGESPGLTYNAALGIGLGVGIGGGVLISAIIVAVYVLARRRGWPGTFPLVKTSQSPDISHKPTGSSYALIPRQLQHQNGAVNTGIHAVNSNDVYNDLEYPSGSTQALASSVDNDYSIPPVIPPAEFYNVEIINNCKCSTVAS